MPASYSLEILNNIRSNGSGEYQARIPEATRENIQSVGNALQTYTPLFNEFTDALVNKIGKTLIESKLFQNRLARFKSGSILSQQDVEEIFIEMAKAEGSYDKTGPNPLGRRDLPDIKSIYHRMNRQDVYAISIGDVDFRRAFRSPEALDTFLSSLVNSIYSGANYDEWLAMKNLIGTYKGYAKYNVPGFGITGAAAEMFSIGASEDAFASNILSTAPIYMEKAAKSFVKTVRKAVADFAFPSTDHNAEGVNTWTEKENMVLLINKDVTAEIDVDVLAKAFNMGKTDFEPAIIEVDGFEMDNAVKEANGMTVDDIVIAVLMDKDWFRVWDTLSVMEPQRNAQGLFTNYFYHVHQILSASRFKNAAVFYTASLGA